MSKEKLKSCKCGGKTESPYSERVVLSWHGWIVNCRTCENSSGYHITQSEAIKAWNRRIK